MGAPIEPETWFNSSGMSTGLMAWSVAGVLQVDTDGAQNPLVENVSACQPPGRARYSPSPCSAFVPDLVTMLSAGPEVQPNSAEKELVSSDISWIAPIGTVAIIVWRPHASSLFAPSRVTVVCRRPPAPVTK